MPNIMAMFYLGAFSACLGMSDNTQQKWKNWFVAFIDFWLYVKYQEHNSLFPEILAICYFESILGMPDHGWQHPIKMIWSNFRSVECQTASKKLTQSLSSWDIAV